MNMDREHKYTETKQTNKQTYKSKENTINLLLRLFHPPLQLGNLTFDFVLIAQLNVCVFVCLFFHRIVSFIIIIII